MADHSRLALVMEDDPKQIALNEIVSSLSHDFRAPLRRVRQFLALIERKHGADFDPETTTWLEFINENTHRMQLMIDSLTELKDVAHFEGVIRPEFSRRLSPSSSVAVRRSLAQLDCCEYAF